MSHVPKLDFRDIALVLPHYDSNNECELFSTGYRTLREANQREKEKDGEGETPTGYPICARERLITSAQQMRTRVQLPSCTSAAAAS